MTKGELLVLLGVTLCMTYVMAFTAGYYDGNCTPRVLVETRTLADLHVPFKGTLP